MINPIIENFHFLYPDWLWLLLPLLAVLFWLGKSKPNDSLLHKLVDPKLAPFVLVGEAGGNSRRLLWLTALLYLLAVVAMAGPSWNKLEQTAYKKEQAVVIALDLSRSMYAKDVQPNRLVRARFEIIDLLQQRKEGQTGLVVYAGDAFAVSPLTDDTENIESQVKLLTPNIMPVQGSQAALAIQKAMQLLDQAEAKQGQILLVTDEIADTAATIRAAKEALDAGIQVSVLSVGTQDGSPITLPQGGFIKDSQGNIVLAKTNPSEMRKVAQAGGGVYVVSDIGDHDLQQLSSQFASNSSSNLVKNENQKVESWLNEGIWLVLLLLPLALLAFRKGYLASVVLVLFVLPQPEPAMALTWDDLWLTPDQQGQKALDKGDAKQAATKFTDPSWKASAEYKAGDYQKALEDFAQDSTVEGLYNKANALVKLNKIPEAMVAYEAVLKQNKDHKDAQYNLNLLKKQQEQQKQKQDQSGQQQNQQQQNSQQQQSDQQQQSQQQQGEGKDSEQKKPSDKSEGEEGDKAQSAQDKAAEEAEKKALEEWKKQQEANKDEKEDGEAEKNSEELTEQQKEQQQATEQWLRRIPDDPSGLWRRKFQYQYGRRSQRGSVGKSW